MPDLKELYPEHMKMKAVKSESQAIGAFLDWLSEEEHPDREGTKYSLRLAYYPWASNEMCSWDERIEKILARYFDIDLETIEAEKQAMLEAIRAENATKVTVTGVDEAKGTCDADVEVPIVVPKLSEEATP